MIFRVHPNNFNFLQLIQATEEERLQIESSFLKELESAKYNPKFKKGYWDGKINFFQRECIPIGLWQKVFDLKKFGYSVDIKGLNEIFNSNLTMQSIKDQLSTYIKLEPRDYQWDAVLDMLKWKFCIEELATSAGKTFVIYLFFLYLYLNKKIKRMLIVVPNTQLIIQTTEEFYSYGFNQLDPKPIIKQIYGGQDEYLNDATVIIGTFQSLTKKDPDWFSDFNAVIVDECHMVNTVSIKRILSYCATSEFRVGLSGTSRATSEDASSWTRQAYLGPVVRKITPEFLMQEGFATQVKIKQFVLDYLPIDKKHELRALKFNVDSNISSQKLLSLEEELVVHDKKRFDFIVNLATKVSKNTIMLFSDVKNSYGKRLYNAIRERCVDKDCYYIDGGTSTEHREYYKKRMEEGNNKILLASFGTFSTGISIKNIHNILLLESYKSDVIINQVIGRGMRLLDSKDFFTIVDLVDNFCIGKYQNFLFRHGKERLKLYNQHNYPIEMHSIVL